MVTYDMKSGLFKLKDYYCLERLFARCIHLPGKIYAIYKG